MVSFQRKFRIDVFYDETACTPASVKCDSFLFNKRKGLLVSGAEPVLVFWRELKLCWPFRMLAFKGQGTGSRDQKGQGQVSSKIRWSYGKRT